MREKPGKWENCEKGKPRKGKAWESREKLKITGLLLKLVFLVWV